jgi:anti-anti-sigma factor
VAGVALTAAEGFTAEGSEDERGYSLVMRGDLDLAYKSMAEEALMAAELAAGERMLILDLRQVEYCGSVGLKLLTAAQQRSIQAGRPLLVLPSRAVRRLFEVTGVTDDFDLGETG